MVATAGGLTGFSFTRSLAEALDHPNEGRTGNPQSKDEEQQGDEWDCLMLKAMEQSFPTPTTP